MTVIRHPALRYHGGKFRIAQWIISHFPQHEKYIEPFGGAAGVLINKPRAAVEVYNDLDAEVVCFFSVLRDPTLAARLSVAVALTPYSRDEFLGAYQDSDCPVERSRRLCVRSMMGFGSAGATKAATGFRADSSRGSSIPSKVWARYPATLLDVAERFRGVIIENSDALSVMRAHDAPDALHFVDPPYLLGTRVMSGSGYYRHELTGSQHRDLLECCLEMRGAVIVCGYDSALYDEALRGWRKVSRRVAAAGARGSVMRTEVLWLSPYAGQSELAL